MDFGILVGIRLYHLFMHYYVMLTGYSVRDFFLSAHAYHCIITYSLYPIAYSLYHFTYLMRSLSATERLFICLHLNKISAPKAIHNV